MTAIEILIAKKVQRSLNNRYGMLETDEVPAMVCRASDPKT